MTRGRTRARVVALLRGRVSADLARALRGQLRAADEGARTVLSMVEGGTRQDEAREHLRRVEHDGDLWRGRLVEELATTPVTPLDREDLFRLSRSLVDVLDGLRDFAQESSRSRLGDQSTFVPLLREVLVGVDHLGTAVEQLLAGSPDAAGSVLRARTAAGAVRRLYQDELAQLVAAGTTPDRLERRDLLRRLEAVGRRVGDAAEAIADGRRARR